MACEDDSTTSEGSTTSTSSSPTTSTANGGNAGQTVGPGGNGGGGNTGGVGGTPTEADCSAPMGNPGAIQLVPTINGLNAPLQLTVAWGDPSRIYIIEQGGVVKLWMNDTLTDFLDISALVQSGGEQGLLGIAFHPDYVNNGRFFLNYTDNGGDHAIQEFARSADPNVADPTPVAEPLFTANDPAGNHNGGSIEFSPVDGFLYIGMGDGGGGCDSTGPNGQNINSVLGKLLRIDINTPPYVIPPGNLPGGQEEIYDYGLRNPYRWTFDVCTGDRYIADVGQNQWEEINVAAAGDGNKNWGWVAMEGMHCSADTSCPGEPDCDPSQYSLPIAEYSHSQGCSVTGGYVYRGTEIPWLRGAYLYGDYCSGRLWMLRWSNGTVSDEQELIPNTGMNISGFGQDHGGEVWVLDHNGSASRVQAM
jgi:glucose/arabinose dehydrogenase